MNVDIADWNSDNWNHTLYLIKVWCDFFCIGRWHRENTIMMFEKEDDALLFILRWQGAT